MPAIFSPDEWIIDRLSAGDFIISLGDGFGDYRLTHHEYRKLRKQVLQRDKHRCVYCGSAATAVDHVFPKSLGGLTVERNLVAACRPCNSHKGGRL
jgi:hypothetical protein